jgi:TPR repeat protein
MADEHELLILPTSLDSSIILWETRSGLIARGRRDAASLLARESAHKLLAEVGSGKTPGLIQLEDARAQYERGRSYSRGEGVAKDYAQAAFWYRRSADQGYFGAQCMLGIFYNDGRGVAQDYAQAALWHRRAANQGFETSQFCLGCLYYYGRGVTQDYLQAAIWYRKAADQGNAPAQHGLGSLYYHGRGFKQDFTQAALWYRKAAEQGYASAQAMLGAVYVTGKGVSEDYSEAYFWFYLAAERETEADKVAPHQKARDSAAAMLTPSQLTGVQERIYSWKAMHR